MKKIQPCLLLALVFIMQSCSTSFSSYVSPLEGTSFQYHAIPMQSDSLKSATYVSANVSLGSSLSSNDFMYSFQGNIHRSHNFGFLQAYYGAGILAGSYRFDRFDQYSYTPNGSGYRGVSPKFFGAYGINGGINAVFNFGSFEWRVIGIEGSLYNEFGEYLNFRKNAPDSTSSIRETNSATKSLGGTTEFLWRRRRGTVFGYKMALGGFFIADKNFNGLENYQKPMYFSNTLHLTKGNMTAFWQINFGSYISTFQMGINYRLGNKKPANINFHH